MFWVLSTLYLLEVAAVTACVVVSTMDTQGVAQPAPLSCGLNSISGWLQKAYASGTWIAPVCFEFIMVLITLARLLPRWKWGEDRGLMGSGGNQTLDVLARDSLIYFGFIFTFTLANAIIYELSFSSHYHSLLLGPTSAISCIAVSRMMINMRSLPSSPLAQPTSTVAAYEREDLSFAEVGFGGDGYEYGGIPDTARTAYFDTAHTPGGYAGIATYKSNASYGAATYGRISRPDTARTSGDATRVGDAESDGGSIIEMGIRKGR